jgi:hypothetical protein
VAEGKPEGVPAKTLATLLDDAYLGRVTKARILGAVREAKDDGQAQLIGHLKKGEMPLDSSGTHHP